MTMGCGAFRCSLLQSPGIILAMNLLKGFNYLLSFLLELAMLFAFGYFGFHSGSSGLVKWSLALGIPLLVAVLWGLFFAPNAKRRFSVLPGVLLSLGLFLLAAWGLWQTGQPVAAWMLAGVAVMNRGLVVVWKQWGN